MRVKTSLGVRRVRASFNPSGDDTVDQVKLKAAELIDLINVGIEATDGEVARLKALAMTDIESGAQWAVKAATAE